MSSVLEGVRKGSEDSMKLKHIQRSESLEGTARVGALFLKDIANGPASTALRDRMDGLSEELRLSIGDRRLSQLEVVRRARSLYHAIGIDPTKDRPPSERLLRRAVAKQDLPSFNKLVDATNYASLALQVPLNVYDWDAIAPPVLIRVGRPEEIYTGVSGSPILLEGNLVLVDGEGPFGSPSQDSRRATVSMGTVRALVVAWSPADSSNEHLEGALKEVAALCDEFCGARANEWGILN